VFFNHRQYAPQAHLGLHREIAARLHLELQRHWLASDV
jgi:hypothetical protein